MSPWLHRQKRVEQADLFIRKRKMPQKLARRVHAYLQYQWETLRGVDESTFFTGLPPVLRSEVLAFLNGCNPMYYAVRAATLCAIGHHPV